MRPILLIRASGFDAERPPPQLSPGFRWHDGSRYNLPVATFRESPVNRFLITALSRWTGEVAAIQDVRRLKEVLRFGGVFVTTLLLPALLLAWFALSSIRSEELSVDADLRARAGAVEAQVQQELVGMFGRFEDQTQRRLAAGGSPIEQIGELSPWLRLVVRMDSRGQVAAPFAPPEVDATLPDYAAFRRPWREGITAERAGDWTAAAAAFDAAAAASRSERLIAEAAFAAARARIRAGGEANTLLTEVYSDHGSLRDRTGFRIGDLVVLLQAELRVDDAPDTAASILQDLVTSVLNRRWILGQATEPSVARHALGLIPSSYEPDWTARARTQLKNRTDQLRWAESVASELELLATSVKVPDGEIRYIAGPDSSTLWGVATLQGDPYLFGFDLAALLEHLDDTARRSTQSDEDLLAELSISRQPAEAALVRRSLSPYLQFVTLTVRPADPAALALQKARRRSVRIAIVVIAVFLVFVGVVLSARIVGQEIENARMKADFAANVSHELRSPITQIRLKAESLQLDLCYDDDDRQAHYDAIVNESERLSRLVDNVLDFAAIERGAKRYNIRSDDLLEVVHLQADSTRETLRSRGLELSVTVPDQLPPVWFDREAIGQVIINLLSNAAKYGADGGWVGLRVEEAGATVELSVSDRGIGISEEELPLVFDDFFRSTDPLVRRKKGTGIGLAIVRYIVEAHGGTIAVESEAGEGATFTISLPTTPPIEV